MADVLSPPRAFDVIVVGGGPAGLAAAVALAMTGASTALVARREPYPDNRTTALLGDSIDFLSELEAWPRCAGSAAPLRVMRLVDSTDRLIRAPEVRFAADEIGIEAFGYNIANRDLVAALEERAQELPSLFRFDEEAVDVASGEDACVVAISSDILNARLVVGADGRRSRCRDAAGIAVTSRQLDQHALTFNVSHSRPHAGISTEFHTAHGPCVLVPLPGDRSSVVWVIAPKEAERLMALPDEGLSAAIERQAQSILGRMTVEPGRHLFPLAIETPSRFAAERIALVGEAAHVVPPIGAQGLNLGLRDAARLAEIVQSVQREGGDIGSDKILARYEAARRADIASRTFVIDMANRSLLSTWLPAHAARAFGLQLLKSAPALRRIAMRQGASLRR